MEPSTELLDALTSQREVVARLEVELAPRREGEAKELAELQGRLATLHSGIAGARERARLAAERIPLSERELTRLEAGLSRAREAWARVLEPVLMSLAVILPIVGWGLTDGRDWQWQAAAGLGGVVLARVVRRARA